MSMEPSPFDPPPQREALPAPGTPPMPDRFELEIPDRARVPARAIWVVAVAVIAALTTGLVLLWQGQNDLRRELRAANRTLTALEEEAGVAAKARAGTEARLGAIEEKVGAQIDVAAVAKQVTPSVFTIESAFAQGSGFVVVDDGPGSLLVTNAHVVQSEGRGGRVRVRQEGRRTIRGTVERVDQVNDLATVRVSATFPALAVSETTPATGDPVIVVGSPLGLQGTVTTGIVSGFNDGLLQFSAPVSPGNSGGPVVDRRGAVIGVAVQKVIGFGAEGLSFAVPIQQVCSVVLRC